MQIAKSLLMFIALVALIAPGCKKAGVNEENTNSKDTTSSVVADIDDPYSLALHSDGTILVTNKNTILRVYSRRDVRTVAGGSSAGYRDGRSDLAEFNVPSSIIIDHQGNFIIVDMANNCVRKISQDVVSTLTGHVVQNGFTDGDLASARFSLPMSVVMDKDNNLLVADAGNGLIRKISVDGTVSTIAGQPGTRGSIDGNLGTAVLNDPRGIAVDRAGNIYFVDASISQVKKISFSTNTVTTIGGASGSGYADGDASVSRFNHPTNVAVDADGNVIVADMMNNKVRKISPAGVTSTVTGDFKQVSDVKIDDKGNIYLAVPGEHKIIKLELK